MSNEQYLKEQLTAMCKKLNEPETPANVKVGLAYLEPFRDALTEGKTLQEAAQQASKAAIAKYGRDPKPEIQEALNQACMAVIYINNNCPGSS